MAQEIKLQVAIDPTSSSKIEQQVGGIIRDIESKQINFKVNSQPLGQIVSDVNQISKSLEAANARVIAFGASVSIISSLSLAFKSLVRDTIEVEKSLNQIGSIVGASTSQLKDLGNSIFDIGRNTATGFEEAARAVSEFARQGIGLEESLKRSNDALILSRISGLELSKAIQTLTANVNAFAGAGLSTNEVLNKLGAVSSHFAASTKDIAEGLSRSASAAQGAKVNFDELTALITSLQQTTQRGGGIIGNAIKSIFTRIERPQVLEDLSQLGIATRDVSGASLSAIEVLTNLARTYDKLGDSQKSSVAEQVGGLFQINLLKSALKDLGGGYSVYSAALQSSLSATNEAITRNQELNKTLAALAVQTGQSALQTGAKVGEKTVAPAISGVLNTANDALKTIGDTIDGKGIGGQIGGQIANAILDVIGQTLAGPGLLIVGALVTKLTVGLAGSLRQAFTAITGQNSEAVQQVALQREIQGTLATNPELYARIASGASSVVGVERQLLELTEARTAALRAQQAISASLSSGLMASGLRAIPVNQGGGFTARAGGLIPEEENAERSVAYGAGYQPGEVKSMEVNKLGRVVYNTAETIKNFSGFNQPAIMPPRGSRGGSNYEKAFKERYGFNPYETPSEETSSGGRRFGGGYVPNFAIEDYEGDFLPGLQNQIRSTGGGPVDLTQGRLKKSVGFLINYGNVNPLRELASQLKNNEIGHIDAGPVVGPRIPAIMASLIEQRKAGKLGDAEGSPVSLSGFMFPQRILDKAGYLQRLNVEDPANRIDNRQIAKLQSAFSKLGVDQAFFRGGEMEDKPFNFHYTVGSGLVPNFASLGDFLNLFGGATTPENGGLAKIASRGTRGLAIRSMVGLNEGQIGEAALGGDLKKLLASVSPNTIQKLVDSGAMQGVSRAHIDALKNVEGGGLVPNYAQFQDSFDPAGGLDIYSRLGQTYSDLSFGARRGDKEVGSLNARLYPDQARITSIAVNKDFRGQGISTELYKRLISEGIGGSRNVISGSLTPQYDENNELKGVYPQLTRARFGKYSDLHFDDRDIRQSFKIRPDSYEQDLLRIQKRLAGKPFADSFPELETRFGAGMIPNFSIGDAMNRERASLAALGYSPQQVSSSIRFAPSSDLLNGGVYNTLQENSITDGVNSARGQGINPLTKGLTPNFAGEFLGGAGDAFRRLNPDLFPVEQQVLGTPARPGTAGQISLSPAQQLQLNPVSSPIVPPTALKDITELGQAILKIGTTAKDAREGITALNAEEEHAVRIRLSARDAQVLGTSEALERKISSIRSEVTSSNVIQSSLTLAREKAINGPTPVNLIDQQASRELDTSSRLVSILSNVGDKFRDNPTGLSNFENQQTERLNRQAALREAQTASSQRFGNEGQIGGVEDSLNKVKLGLNRFTSSEAFQNVTAPVRGLGNRLAAAQLPIILGSESVTAGARQLFGANSTTAAASEAISSAASIGAVVAAINPIAGGLTAIGIASYKLVDAFSASSTRLRVLTEEIERQKESLQKTRESATSFLSGRGSLEDAINNGANPRDITRLANKDQENFSRLTPNIQTAVAGITDPRQISQIIQDELEKHSKALLSKTSEAALLTDRKTIFSSFGGFGEKGEESALEKTKRFALRGSIGIGTLGLSELALSANDASGGILRSGADKFFRGNNQFGRFDGTEKGDVRLGNTVELLQGILGKDQIAKEQSSGTLATTLKGGGFNTEDIKALTGEFDKLSKTQKLNEEVTKAQNARLIENSQIQNQLNRSIELYNKSLLQNAQTIEILGSRAIGRQRAGNQIIQGSEETQNAISSFAAKKQIDLLADSLGVSASGKSNLQTNNSIIDINNQRSLGINKLTSDIGPEVQTALLSFVSGLSKTAQALNAKQKNQTVDSEGAALVNDNSLNEAQNKTSEAIRLLPSALQDIVRTGNIKSPAEAIDNIGALIEQLRKQQTATTSPEVAIDIGQQINKLSTIQDSLATGFSNLNNTAQKQLQEAIINNEATQRLIELNRNRGAAGGFAGFEDFSKRIAGFTQALPGFEEAFKRIGNAGPGLATNAFQIGANPNDIGALVPLLKQAQALGGGGKGEITEQLAGQLAEANAASVRSASGNLLGGIGRAVNGSSFDPSRLNNLDLTKFTNEFSDIEKQRTSISGRLLSGDTDVDEKQRLRAQNDALARQQQDVISRATKETTGLVGGFSTNEAQKGILDASIRAATEATVRSRAIGRDQVTGEFDVLGADKKVDVNKLNNTLDTGKQTVSELIKLSDKVLSNESAKEYLGRVTSVATESKILEQRIQADVALIRVQAEKNQADNKKTSIERALNTTGEDLSNGLGRSQTFKALGTGEGLTEDFKGSSIGRAALAGTNSQDRLERLKNLAETINAGNSGAATVATRELTSQGLNPAGKNVGEIFNQLLQFTAKGSGQGANEGEKNNLERIGSDFSRLDTLKNQLRDVDSALEPLNIKFKTLKDNIQELGRNSAETSRKDLLGSVSGSPEQVKNGQEGIKALLTQLDELREKAQTAKTASDQFKGSATDGQRLKDISDKANNDFNKFGSEFVSKVKGFGATADISTINLAAEGSPGRPLPANIPSNVGSSSGIPSSQIGNPGFKSNAGGFYNSLADFKDSQAATYRNKPGEQYLPEPNERGEYNIKGYYGLGSVNKIPSSEGENARVGTYQEGPLRQENLTLGSRDVGDKTKFNINTELEDNGRKFIKSIGGLAEAVDQSAGQIKPKSNPESVDSRQTSPNTSASAPQGTFNIPVTVTINQSGGIDKEAVITQVTAALRDQLKDVPGYAPPPPGGPDGIPTQYNPNIEEGP